MKDISRMLEELERLQKEVWENGLEEDEMANPRYWDSIDCPCCDESAMLVGSNVPKGEDPRRPGAMLLYLCTTCGEQTALCWMEKTGVFQDMPMGC